MIRVYKSPVAPSSLSRTKAHDGEDVIVQLCADMNSKCYICERVLVTDVEVEHVESRKNKKESAQSWNNLFLSCGYCNKRKSNYFDDIHNPAEVNIEDEIKQDIGSSNKKAIFTAVNPSSQSNKTVKLLSRIFNGTGGIRKYRNECFYEYCHLKIGEFQTLILNYMMNPTVDNQNMVREGLAKTEELLGFKYWIIKSNPELEKVFKSDIVWNKNNNYVL